MFKQRLITILILLPLALSAIFFLPNLYWALILGVVVLGCALEWAALFKFGYLEKGAYLTLMGALLAISSQMSVFLVTAFSLIFWVVMMGLVVAYKPQENPAPPSKMAASFLGVMLLVPFWQSTVWLADGNRWVLLSLFLLVWSADTFAYIGGKTLGKHLFMPFVSPKKTWEGVLFGLVGLLGVASLLYWAGALKEGYGFTQSFLLWFLGGILIFVFALFGDLFESLVKRIQGVKDSGHCLPGHGGVLDRLDSLFAAAPLFVFLCGKFS